MLSDASNAQRYAAPTQSSSTRLKAMVPKPLASSVAGVKRARDASKPGAIRETKRKVGRSGSIADENDDARSVSSSVASLEDMAELRDEPVVADSEELKSQDSTLSDSMCMPIEGDRAVDTTGDPSTPETKRSSGDDAHILPTSVKKPMLDNVPLMTNAEQRRHAGRAKRIISEELLPIYNTTPKELLIKKQISILFLEELIKSNKNGEAYTKLREAEAAIDAKKMEAVQSSVKVASQVGEIIAKTKEIQEKNALIEKLTHEIEGLKSQHVERDAHSEKQLESKLADITAQHKKDLAMAKEKAGLVTEEHVKRLHASHEKEMAAAKAAALEHEKRAIAASLAAAETEFDAKEAKLTQELALAKDEAEKLKAEVRGLQLELEQMQAKLSEQSLTYSAQVEAAMAGAAMWKEKFEACDAKRVALVEECITLKGNIRVFARVRPMLKAELDKVPAGKDESSLFHFPDARDDATVLEVVEKPGLGVGGYGVGDSKRHRFELQRVFPPLATQEDMFKEVEGVIQSCLNGHRVCIFAYGQTSSGKTHTMQGGEGCERGIIPRAVEFVFERVAVTAERGWSCKISVEMLEIYNEELRDLFPGTSAPLKHEIRHDKEGNTVITNLSTHEVGSPEEVYALLSRAASNRATGATNSNTQSSRSHSVFTLKLTMTHAATSQQKSGILNLIDLAGSERIAKSGVNDSKAGGSDKLLKETQCINKSLSSLAQVIMALRANNSHIPYRDSKLTYLLQNSLGATSKTLMICNLNPLHSNAQESVCTLRFAKSVSEVSLASGK